MTSPELLLDETSLTPSNTQSPGERIRTLAASLKAMDALGITKVLRSVRDAADRDIGGGKGLRVWCYDRNSGKEVRDAGRLVASRLSRQPFVDGVGGLLATAEGSRAIEATAREQAVLGLGLAALNDFPVIALDGVFEAPETGTITVGLKILDEDSESGFSVEVPFIVSFEDVERHQVWLTERIQASFTNGDEILTRAKDVWPSLKFCPQAVEQLTALTGREPFFTQLIRHLRALEGGARTWSTDQAFSPDAAIAWSPESDATLKHGKYGPMRDFPVLEGFAFERWSFHTKLTGGNGARLYFQARRTNNGPVILIGYVGSHLPTIKFQ